MPLKIQLKKGQKIIINGAVIENVTQRNVSLLVGNDASILRDSDILTPEDAATPASRAYYALQCLYVFPDESTERNRERFEGFLASYEAAAPSCKPITEAVRDYVEKGELYHAVKKCQELIFHEQEILTDVQEKLGRELREAAGAGGSAGD